MSEKMVPTRRLGEQLRTYRLIELQCSCFSKEFPHVNDVCYLAHCYPYSYTDLENYLQIITNDPIKYRYCKQQVRS